MHLPVSLTILLLTSSSIALTNSAALGVSELVGRTNNREDVCAMTQRKENPRVSLVLAQGSRDFLHFSVRQRYPTITASVQNTEIIPSNLGNWNWKF